MSREYFGYIILHHKSDEQNYGNLTRIGTIDIDYVEQQALYGSEVGCHVRTDDGFCSSSYTVKETASQVLELIAKHDQEFGHFVRDFAARNNFVMVKERSLW